MDEKSKILVDYFQAIIILRDARKNFFNKGIVIWWRIAQRLFKKYGVSEELIRYYTFHEMQLGEKYFEENIKALEERKNGFVCLLKYDGSIKYEYSNFEANKASLLECFLRSNGQNTSETPSQICGQIGAPGKIQGKVRIVIDPQSVEFMEGEILVAGMTRPEYVPLMKKAAGIITDEGGITCHAAILSREMKKPCIIGTRIATKVLNDGDLVEIDTDKGMVRKI